MYLWVVQGTNGEPIFSNYPLVNEDKHSQMGGWKVQNIFSLYTYKNRLFSKSMWTYWMLHGLGAPLRRQSVELHIHVQRLEIGLHLAKCGRFIPQ